MSIFDFREIRKANIFSCYNVKDITKSNDHLQHKYIRKEGDKYIYEEPKKDLHYIKKDINFDLSKTQNMNSNLDQIVETAQPLINEMVENFKEWSIKTKQGQAPSTYDLKMYELDVVIDLVKAVGKYINDTDTVSDIDVDRNSGVITMNCFVTRDGVKNFMQTDVIIAGGYNIQSLHYRYITKTALPSNQNNSAASKLIAKKNKIEKTLSIQHGIENENKYYEGRLASYNRALKLTQKELFESKSYGDDYTYDSLHPESQKMYSGRDQFNEFKQDRLKEIWSNHLIKTSPKYLKSIESEHAKEMKKFKDRLDKL